MFRLRFALVALAGAALVTGIVAVVLYSARGGRMELKGEVLRVRTVSIDENSSAAVVDFRFTNTAGYPWVVRSVEVLLTGAGGELIEGSTIADEDAARLFEYFPLLGQKYNPSLLIRTRIGPRQTEDRMIAARFEVPERELQTRRGLRVRIEDVDGAVSEIAAGGAP